MSAEGVGQAPTAGTAGQVPADGTQHGTAAGAAAAPEAAKTTFDAEYVKALRDEAAKHRTDKAAVEAELKKLRDAQLSDTERAAQRLKELEAETANYRTERKQLKRHATRCYFVIAAEPVGVATLLPSQAICEPTTIEATTLAVPVSAKVFASPARPFTTAPSPTQVLAR